MTTPASLRTRGHRLRSAMDSRSAAARNPRRFGQNRLRAPLLALAVSASIGIAGCTREERPPEADESPIQTVRLPTPTREVRVRDVGVVLRDGRGPDGGSESGESAAELSPTAAPSEPATAPTARPTKPPAAPAVTRPPATKQPPAARPTPIPTVLPTAVPTERPTRRPTSVPPTAPPKPTKASPARESLVIAGGTDLYDAPDGEILGTFGGDTRVDLFESRPGWRRIDAPVAGGEGSVTGWVRTTPPVRVEDRPKPTRPPAAEPTPIPARPEPTKAPAPPKKPSGDKGPEEMVIEPLRGTKQRKPGTWFPHRAHEADYGVACADCHHPVKAKGETEATVFTCSTSGCHEASQCNGADVPRKNAACPNFEDAYHESCRTCHRQEGGPTSCSGCHTG